MKRRYSKLKYGTRAIGCEAHFHQSERLNALVAFYTTLNQKYESISFKRHIP